jgi:hypothetical protein
MKHVFPGGDGIIYAVNQKNQLLWYRHLGFADGTDQWQTSPDPKGYIGENWDMQHVFSAGSGVIYAVNNQAQLLWYRHLGFVDGVDRWQTTPDPKGYIGESWNMNDVFAGDLNVPILPVAPADLEPGNGWNVDRGGYYLSFHDPAIGTTAESAEFFYDLTELDDSASIGLLSPGSPTVPPGRKLEGLNPGKFTVKAWGQNEVGPGPAATSTFTVLADSAPTPTPPPATKPVITVTSSNSGGAFVVSGEGFSVVRDITIRVVDDQLVTAYFHHNSDAAGKLNANIPLACRSGFALHFSATDGRSDPADVTGSLWSNTFSTNCP